MSLITTDLDFRLSAKLGITESAGVISEWVDQQGAHALTVPATFAGPKIGDVQLNGHNVVTFNGVDQLLDNASIGERRPSASNFSMTYLYCRAPASNGFRYMVDQSGESANLDTPKMSINTQDTNQVRGRSGGSSDSVVGGYTADTWMVVTIRWARDDAGSGDDVISKLYIDGVEVNTNTFTTSGSAGIRLGGRADDSGYAPFDMVEMLEYHNISAAHTQNQIDQNVAYLQDEWALQNELTINITGAGSGSVTKDPDKSAYEDNEVVTLTSIPDAGSAFKEFTGDLNSREASADITMNGDKTVGAEFVTNAVWVEPIGGAQVGATPTLRTRRTKL